MAEPVDKVYAEVGFKSTLDKDLSGINTSLNKAQSQVEKFGKSISTGVGSSISTLGSQFSKIGTSLSNGLGSAFTKAGQVVTKFGTTLSSGLGGAFKRAGFEIDAFGGGITRSMGNALSGIGEKIKGLGGSLSTSLGNSLSSVGSKISTIGSSISKGFGNVVSGLGTKISSLGSSISSGLGSALSGVSSKIQSFGSAISTKLSSAFNSAKTAISNFATSATNSFSNLVSSGQKVADKLGYIGVIATAAFTNILKNAIQGAAEEFYKFDDVMRQVQAVTDTTGTMLTSLTQRAQDLGAETSFTTKEVADAMVIMGQQGFTANEIMSAIPDTLNLARSSMTDLTTTVDIMTAIMKSFNIESGDTSRVSDVMAKAANSTATDVTGLGEAMKYTSALAYQMGWSLEETAAAAGLLSNAGIKNSMAGTVLRNAITRLIAPVKNVSDTLESYGISLESVNPKTHSLAEILDTLGAHAVSSGDMMKIFGMRAGPGMMALVNQGTDALRKEIEVLQQSGGYAEEAAKKMDAGLGGAIRQIQGSIENFSISIGRAAGLIFTPILNAGTALINVLAKIPAPFLAVGVAIASLTVAAGSLIVGLAALPTIAGVLTSGMSVLAGGMLKLGTVLFNVTGSAALLGPAFTLATAPIAAIVASIGQFVIVGAALGIVIYELEEKTHILSNTWQVLQDLFTIAVDKISRLFEEVRNYVIWWIDDIKSAFEDTGISEFIDSIEDAYDKVSSFFGGIKDSIHAEAEDIREENDKAALSAKNVQESIKKANEGVISSYETTHDAAGNSYAEMIESASDYSESTQSANGDVISSNSEVVTSTNEVTSSIKTLKEEAAKPTTFSITETNVKDIFGDTTKTDISAINKGIELADGSILRFNKDGELVIQTVDGIVKKVADLASTSLELESGKKIGIISPGTQTLNGSEPPRTISLEEAGQNAIADEAYLKSPEYKRKVNAEKMGYTIIEVDQPIPKNQYYTPQEQAKIDSGEWTGPVQTPTKVSVKTTKDSEENIRAAARETSDEYKLRLEEYNRTGGKSGTGKGGTETTKSYNTGPWGSFFKQFASIEGPSFGDIIKTKMGDVGTYFEDGYKSLTKFVGGIGEYSNEASIAGTTTQDWNRTFKDLTGIDLSKISGSVVDIGKDALGTTIETDSMGNSIHSASVIDFSGLVNSIFGVGEEETTAAGKATDHKGILDTLNGVSFGGLVNSIFGIGSEQDTASGKATDHKGALDTLNGVSFGGLVNSIFGIGSEQDTASGKATGHKGVLDNLNGTSFGSLISNIFGIGSEQDAAGSKGTTHKGILDLINGTPMGSVISQILGIGSEQDTASGKGTTHKGVLDTINSTSMGSIISQIFGVGTESNISTGKAGFLKLGLDLVNKTSLGSIIGQLVSTGLSAVTSSLNVSGLHGWISKLNSISLSTIKGALEGLISTAQTAWEKVTTIANNAISSAKTAISTQSKVGSSSSNNSSTTNTLKVSNINNYGSTISTSTLKKFMTGGL